MKISYNWLKNYLDFDLEPEETAKILTDTGLEVEGLEKVETIKGGLEGVVIGEVLTKEKHPDADRLNVTTVDVASGEPLQIVCGAPNVEAGQKVVVATPGCTLYPDPEKGFKIKKSKIRGVESNGMICAEDELGLGESHDGIMVLEDSVQVGMPARDYFKIEDDYLIEIGLTPNRADAMGHIGVARDLKAYLNYHKGQSLQLNIDDTTFSEGEKIINLTVENEVACPRYSGVIVSGVKVADSPDWLQNKLRVIGLNPINNIVDITNFVMFESGNPLHAFDLTKTGGDIVVRNARKGEKIVGLDEVERELSENDLMICNKDVPMCIAGVFGGLDSGVQDSTTDIFLEAAYFNPVSVRKTAKRHTLNTDSSFRFERGVDPNNVSYALNRAAKLIAEVAGGTIEKVVDHYPNKIEDFEVDFNFDRCRKLAGITISDEEILSILNELDITEISKEESQSKVKVPAYRVDVQREADVVEEVLRIYGFNNVALPEKLNTSISYRSNPDREKLYNTVADLLTNNGFSEIMNNSLTSSALWSKLNSGSFNAEEDVAILNPLSQELDVMRQTLLPGGLKSIEYNQNRQFPDLKFFEFGSVYKKSNEEYQENGRLGIWISGKKAKENWSVGQDKANFYTLKGVIEALLGKLGIDKAVNLDETEVDLFEYGYQLSITRQLVGEFGLVQPKIAKKFGLKGDVFYADLDWDKIVDLSVLNKITAKPLPKTQFARRDFSLLLNESVEFSAIEKIAYKVDKKILKEVGLFDVYQGKNLEKGKKSYAVSFTFQDDEKTLKDKQLDAIMDNIRKKLETELGAELR
ncbi:MAG: phenylalanine--tRNA ligase subunit beta [Flavobacteriales bacterium]|nr:phenylalanine--tRNA ligase subunit beta [Flavobacteriales bacterium]